LTPCETAKIGYIDNAT